MATALITLRCLNDTHAITPKKEAARRLRGEFVALKDGTEFYQRRPPDWTIKDNCHFFLFVKDIEETINGKPWLDVWQDWLLSPMTHHSRGQLDYDFANKSYQVGEQIIAGRLTGEVESLEDQSVEGVQFRFDGKRKKLRQAKSIIGHMSKATADIMEITVDERDDSPWFIIGNRRGDFLPGEPMSFGRRIGNKNNLVALQVESFHRGRMFLDNVSIDGNIVELEKVIGQTSGAEGVLLDAGAKLLARTESFLPLSKLPQNIKDDFNTTGWSEMIKSEFANCVKRHPENQLPDRDPMKMDDNAVDHPLESVV